MPRTRRRPRRPDQQLDFLMVSPQPTSNPLPGWSVLPDQARQAVTELMTRLLIAHAGGAAGHPGNGDDER